MLGGQPKSLDASGGGGGRRHLFTPTSNAIGLSSRVVQAARTEMREPSPWRCVLPLQGEAKRGAGERFNPGWKDASVDSHRPNKRPITLRDRS